jgi:hypothetical protein
MGRQVWGVDLSRGGWDRGGIGGGLMGTLVRKGGDRLF